MASGALSSFGTQLQVDDGALNFTTIAEILDISGPALTSTVQDVTNHASPQAWMEKIVTLLEVGPITFDINYIPTGATHNASAGLISLLKNRTKRSFKIIFTDVGPTNWVVSGYVTGMSPTMPVNGVLRGSITITPTGVPTLA